MGRRGVYEKIYNRYYSSSFSGYWHIYVCSSRKWSDQAKEYPNIRLYLEDLLTDNEYGVHIDDKNGQEITEEFLNDYQEIYDKEGLDTVMDGYIDEFAENGYSLSVDHPKKFTKS